LRYDVAVIGAGINGVYTALELLDRGIEKIAIIEKNYPGSGGTFRCATGIRASFTSREHVVLMKRSIEKWKELSNRFGFPFVQGGYVWLLSREEHLRNFKEYVRFHHSLGVPTRIVDPDEIKELVPTIKTDTLVAGVHDPIAGKSNPFTALLNVLEYLKKSGVEVRYPEKAEKIIVENREAKGVLTEKERVEAETILVAAGYGSRDILSTCGVDAPINNLPKHALITEKYREVFKPLLVDWETASYMVQTVSGGFLIGAELEEEYNRPPMNRIEFLYTAVRIWSKYFDWFPSTHIIRYWTGYYVMTPDHHPILGPVKDVESLYVSTGFSGHGFMIAPAASEAVAEWIVRGKPGIREAENLTIDRFKEGRLIHEIAVFG